MVAVDPDLQTSFDASLWIVTTRSGPRGFIVGNCHTHQGRMAATFPDDGSSRCVSKGEVLEASDAAWQWIDGFLSGSEPTASDMYGPGVFDLPDDHPKLQHWRDAVTEYRQTGSWPYAHWHPRLVPLPTDGLVPSSVWTLRGAEVWAWTGSRWVPADPQPDHRSGWLTASLCRERGRCSGAVVSDVHTVCRDCGRTTFSIPDDLTWGEWAEVEATYVARPC
jgi:hypothetical protein